MKSKNDEIVDRFVLAALNTLARLAVIPAQDLFNLDNSARMNEPGTLAGNWTWRMQAKQISSKLSEKYKEINTAKPNNYDLAEMMEKFLLEQF